MLLKLIKAYKLNNLFEYFDVKNIQKESFIIPFFKFIILSLIIFYLNTLVVNIIFHDNERNKFNTSQMKSDHALIAGNAIEKFHTPFWLNSSSSENKRQKNLIIKIDERKNKQYGEVVDGSELRGKYFSYHNYIDNVLDSPGNEKLDQSSNAIEKRKVAFRETAFLKSDGNNFMPIFAYEGLKIDEADIDRAIYKLKNEETGDFTLAQLVRVLYFTREYDHKILPVLKNLDYWLTKGENKYCYWSENHMIMWMSSAYLMKQKEGWDMDKSLEKRLRHYLKLKIDHGYYEFFSSTYKPFTLAGLLNLADFAEDEEIRSNAETAAKILIKQMLLVFNENGAYYPAAGRNHSDKYKYFHPSSIMMILSGLGEKRNSIDYIGGFLSTSNIDLSDVAKTWSNSLNTRLKLGHTQINNQVVHAGLIKTDRILFQWSSGEYFHPKTADDSVWIIDSYDMQNHDHFKIFKKIPDFPDKWSNVFTKIGATWARASSISKAVIDIYKNRGVVLTSLNNFYGGYVGYQQWPWAATVEDIAVWTQSGKIKAGWPKSGMSANSHLPKVFQDGNVAMIVYKPNLELRALQLLGEYNTSVSLYWPTDRFDVSFEWSKWIIGRKDDSYIAVFRYGKDKRKGGGFYSDANNGRQLWAAIVGNRDTHQSFSNFIKIVKRATVKEKYEWNYKKFRKVYFTQIIIDGKSIRQWW